MSQISNLAQVVIARTYARPVGDRVETYPEIIERVIGGNIKNHNISQSEIERLRFFMLNRKALPAGRGLWISGTKIQDRIGGAALVNCWGLTADDWNNYVIASDLLMLGGGVGFSVEDKYVNQLPKIRKGVTIIHKFTKDADYIVPDSREGWCRLIYKVMEAWFVTGKGFSYSTICVRGQGEAILGFGGISSGPRPLVRMVEKLCSVFMTRQDKKLRPIDAADVMCCIAEMVVSGNVRRSAVLIQGDAWNKEYLKAKRWDLGPVPTQRAMANFSVVASDVENDLRPLFWETYKHGEPFGIINLANIRKYGRMGEELKDTAQVVNPCQPAWATVLTPKGISTIGEVKVGDTIWSGKQWTKIVNKTMTGVKQVNAYETKIGPFCGTENHGVLSNGVKIEVGKAKSIDSSISPFESQKNPQTTFEITEVVPLDKEEVYSITVDAEEHTYWSGGLLVGNCGEATLQSGESCNLQDINLTQISDVNEFAEAAKLMHRWGKRVAMERYHYPQIQEIVNKNHRIGTSITGCLQREDLFNPAVLDHVYQKIQEENVSYSKELDIDPSIRTTVIKPSGTLSKAFDCPCEGIHPAFSKHFIQRIRIASNDPLIERLRTAGHHMEPQQRLDGTPDSDTMVVDFYVKTPEGVPCADDGFDTWKQLDAVKMAQKHWADQSISVTTYYKDGDLPKIQEWLTNNLDEIKTVSFLRHSGHGFVQAPKEAISEDQYDFGTDI